MTFNEYVKLREGMTAVPGMPQDKDNTDDEIMKNPQLLNKKQLPGQDLSTSQKVVNQAIQNKRQNPRVSLDAALKASAMADKRL